MDVVMYYVSPGSLWCEDESLIGGTGRMKRGILLLEAVRDFSTGRATTLQEEGGDRAISYPPNRIAPRLREGEWARLT